MKGVFTLQRSPRNTTAAVPELGPMVLPTARMPWHLRMLCGAGFHRGPWNYLAEAECNQMRVCQRCGKARRRVRHQREWEYLTDGDCRQRKICRRCDEITSHRIRHVWGPTHSVGESNVAHRCERCGKVEQWTVTG